MECTAHHASNYTVRKKINFWRFGWDFNSGEKQRSENPDCLDSKWVFTEVHKGRVLNRWQAQMSLNQSLKYEVRVSGKPGVNPSSLPLKKAKGSCLFSGTWRLLWHLYSLLSHGKEAPSLPDGRQQKQLHKQFKSRLLSGDFTLLFDSSLTLTPDISPHRPECLMSLCPELSPSVQLPLFPGLFFISESCLLTENVWGFFNKQNPHKQKSQQSHPNPNKQINPKTLNFQKALLLLNLKQTKSPLWAENAICKIFCYHGKSY